MNAFSRSLLLLLPLKVGGVVGFLFFCECVFAAGRSARRPRHDVKQRGLGVPGSPWTAGTQLMTAEA